MEKTLETIIKLNLKKVLSGCSGADSDDVTTSPWPLFLRLNYLNDTMQTSPRKP